MIATWAASAWAVAPGWFEQGASRVVFSAADDPGSVEVPLLLGADDPRPHVEARIGERESVAAVLDLASGPSSIGAVLAGRHGLRIRSASWRGRSVRVAVAPWLWVGDLVLSDVHLQVVTGSELVLGVATFAGLQTAVLPSEGVVRFRSDEAAEGWLSSVGTVYALTEEPQSWWEGGERRVRMGPRHGIVVSGGGPGQWVSGVARIESAQVHSAVAPRFGPPEVLRVDQRVTTFPWEILGLPRGPTALASPVDPSADRIASVAADRLASMDVAVAPSRGVLALSAPVDARWASADEARLRWLEAQAVGWPQPVPAPEPVSVHAGEPGDALARRRWSDLAQARWRVGRLQQAVEADASLAIAAGDHCGPWLDIGGRRVEVGQLVLAEQALQRSAELYEAWVRQAPEARRRARRGRPAADAFTVEQPDRCAAALGQWMRVRLMRSDLDGVEVLLARDHGNAPDAPRVAAVALLPREPVRAEALVRMALSRHSAGGGQGEASTLGWLAVVQAMDGRPEAAAHTLTGISRRADPHRVVSAALTVGIAALASPDDGGAARIASLLQGDPSWVELSAAAVHHGLSSGPDAELNARVHRAAHPGDPSATCLHAYLSDDELPVASGPPHPDCDLLLGWKTGGDQSARNEAHARLSTLWPAVPTLWDDPDRVAVRMLPRP